MGGASGGTTALRSLYVGSPASLPRIAAQLIVIVGIDGLRFVLTWETDANDVDFHVEDGAGGHAYYGHRELESGGELYADVTRGYGPECFTVRKDKAHRGSYALKAHYYSRGPMGYGMGKVAIIEHDGKGGLKLEDRPFVVMTDGAFVDLGAARLRRSPEVHTRAASLVAGARTPGALAASPSLLCGKAAT